MHDVYPRDSRRAARKRAAYRAAADRLHRATLARDPEGRRIAREAWVRAGEQLVETLRRDRKTRQRKEERYGCEG